MSSAIAKLATAKAARMWRHELSNSEKAGICQGLFPADKMERAVNEGYDRTAVTFALLEQAAQSKQGVQKQASIVL